MKTVKNLGFIYVALFVVGVYFLLAIPDTPPSIPLVEHSATTRAFVWNQDERWDSLEASYAAAQSAGCGAVRQTLESSMSKTSDICVMENAYD